MRDTKQTSRCLVSKVVTILQIEGRQRTAPEGEKLIFSKRDSVMPWDGEYSKSEGDGQLRMLTNSFAKNDLHLNTQSERATPVRAAEPSW